MYWEGPCEFDGIAEFELVHIKPKRDKSSYRVTPFPQPLVTAAAGRAPARSVTHAATYSTAQSAVASFVIGHVSLPLLSSGSCC